MNTVVSSSGPRLGLSCFSPYQVLCTKPLAPPPPIRSPVWWLTIATAFIFLCHVTRAALAFFFPPGGSESGVGWGMLFSLLCKADSTIYLTLWIPLQIMFETLIKWIHRKVWYLMGTTCGLWWLTSELEHTEMWSSPRARKKERKSPRLFKTSPGPHHTSLLLQQ